MTSLGKTYTHPSDDWSDSPQCILIVDDEPRMRSSLRQLLACAGRSMFECATGSEALSTLKSQEIDLVLLDINLPDISGLEVMEWIAANNIPVSVIMVSADAHIDSAIRALRSGVVEYVRKPYDLEDLQHKVDSALHRRLLERCNILMTARLEQSERLHRFLVESSPDLIYTLDSDGCFIFINGRVESLLGYTRTELVGSHYTVIVHEEDLEHAVYAFTERRSEDRAQSSVTKQKLRVRAAVQVRERDEVGEAEHEESGDDPNQKWSDKERPRDDPRLTCFFGGGRDPLEGCEEKEREGHGLNTRK